MNLTETYRKFLIAKSTISIIILFIVLLFVFLFLPEGSITHEIVIFLVVFISVLILFILLGASRISGVRFENNPGKNKKIGPMDENKAAMVSSVLLLINITAILLFMPREFLFKKEMIIFFILLGAAFLLFFYSFKKVRSERKYIKYIPKYKDNLEASVYGVARTGFYSRGYSLLGVGKSANFENTMFITDRRIILASIPIHREGKILGVADLSLMNSIFNKEGIRKKAKELIKGKEPQEIFDSYGKKQLDLSRIEKIEIKDFTMEIKILMDNGKKYKYGMLTKENLEKARKGIEKVAKEKIRK